MDAAARRRACLDAMGVTAWAPRHPAAADGPVEAPAPGSACAPAAEAPPVAPLPPGAEAGPAAGLDWDGLAAAVAACQRCELHARRTQTVFGVGNRAARWLVIGEAPGQEEDRRGEPFVGRAGQLLNSMLEALGLSRGEVYIANILKCRPPDNRDPRPEEVACCAPWLARQIELLAPQIILCVGRIAAQNLLGVQTPIGKLRGQRHVHAATGIPVVVTYHPAYLLRSPAEKRRAWQDLLFARRIHAESA